MAYPPGHEQSQNVHIDSPPRPPVSPITPVVSFAELAAQQLPPPIHPYPPAERHASPLPSTSISVNPAFAIPTPPTPKAPAPPQPGQAHRPLSQAQTSTIPTAASLMPQSQPPVPPTTLSQPTHMQPVKPPAVQTSSPEKPLAPSTDSKPRFIPPPEPIAVPEEDNADAAALRSALAILQIQREKSQKDIQTLTKLREAARLDVDAFTEQMLAGNLSQTKNPSDPLAATLEDDSADEDSDDAGEKMQDTAKLPKFPTRQNIVRCPPVNWAKYHVVGDSLDRMHEDQRRRPTHGAPSTGDWAGRDHVVAAPYSPLDDRAGLSPMEHPMVTRKGGKRL